MVVPCDGVLHFAVNDVVMSDKNIKDMYLKSLQLFKESINDNNGKNELQLYIDSFDKILKNNKKDKNKKDKETLKDIIIEDDNVGKFLQKYEGGILSKKEAEKNKEIYIKRKNLIDNLKNLGYGFGVYYQKDDSMHEGYPFVNELIYYYDKEYRDPWYMDNVGSFLIVIERKTNK